MSDPALLALLEVQVHDTKLDQLRHALLALPEREARDAATTKIGEIERATASTTDVRDDLTRQQKKVDDEVELLKDKRTGFDTKLYGGTVTSPGELQDLQKEIDSLSRRISQLEDAEIEIMEQVEPVEEALAKLATSLTDAQVALADAEAALAAAEADLRSQVEAEQALRAEAVTPVADDMLAAYEKLRSGRGGIAIARLIGAQCGGCHLTLSAMEAARMRKLPDGEIGYCEECGRILVA